MKGKFVLFVTIISMISSTIVFSNGHGPPPHYFNELYFENEFWILELFTLDFENLDGWYLTTVNDTAYFMDGINPAEDYILITPGYGYLESPLSINKNGDWLCLYNLNDEQVDELIFGNMYNAIISASLPGQSICVLYDDGFIHYLDNSPTLGQPNDYEDAQGTIEGNVLDASGSPLINIEINYHWSTVYTNSNGYFSFDNIAVMAELQVVYNAMILDHFVIQNWPDSTVTLAINIKDPLLIEENEIAFNYQLDQNYPNPFNPSTKIKYQIPEISFVTIKIYDVLGNEIETLVNEEKNAGIYEIEFDASSLTGSVSAIGGYASGIYFYQLKAGSYIETKKMLLIK
jgi:hypothetical protein